MRSAAIVLTAALLAGCAGKPAPAPSPPPAAASAGASPRIVVPERPDLPVADWSLRPLTPGDWIYDAGAARYAGFALRCDPAGRRISLVREGAGGPVRIRTTYGERALPPGGAVGADDPLLDEIAFSRGRFAVEAAGSDALIVPSWPEAGRVVEDCRG